jgi:hypothetical protein
LHFEKLGADQRNDPFIFDEGQQIIPGIIVQVGDGRLGVRTQDTAPGRRGGELRLFVDESKLSDRRTAFPAEIDTG